MLGTPSRDHDNPARHHLVALTAFLFTAGSIPAAANTVEAISWDHDSSGRTVVVVVCAEAVDPSLVRSYPLADPARAVVVIGGITQPVKPGLLTIDDPQISQLRLGHHDEVSPAELHVIFDLQSETAGIHELRLDGARISIVVGSRSGPTATHTPPDSPTPLPSPLPPTPSPTPSPSPSSTPSPTPVPALGATPASPDRPAPPVLPTVPATPTAVAATTLEPPPVSSAFPSPASAGESERATRVIDIAASPRGDGSTLLRITTNGRLPLGSARVLEIADDSPRVILTIRGISAPDLPRTIEIGDANLDRIRLVHDAETSEDELHLVLHLTRTGISVTEMKQVGPHLVVQLTPNDPTPPTP